MNRAGRTAEEEHVRKSVRSLLAWNDMSVEDLSDATGIPRATLYKRMSTKPGPARSWLMKEVVDLGRVFGVDVQDLINGTVSLGDSQRVERSVNNRNLTTRQAAA